MEVKTDRLIVWAAGLFIASFLGGCQQQTSHSQGSSDDMIVIEDQPAANSEEQTAVPEENQDDGLYARVEFSDTVVNIGKMHKGDVRTFDVRYSNTGDLPIKIDYVDTGCSCTKVEYPSVTLQPGESSVLHFTFDAHDELMFGDKERYILISLVETTEFLATEEYILFRYEIIPDSQPTN